MAVGNRLTSKYLRVFSVTADKYGIDPILDRVVGKIVKIPDYSIHQITQDEKGAPDLISLREYQTDELWWAIMTYNRMGSYKLLVEGLSIKIPNLGALIAVFTENVTRPSETKRVITI